MNTIKHIEVNAANGYTYRFEEGLFGTIFTYYWDRHLEKWMQTCRTFKSFEEALVWVEDMAKAVESKPSTINYDELDCSDYYGVRGRYYGD